MWTSKETIFVECAKITILLNVTSDAIKKLSNMINRLYFFIFFKWWNIMFVSTTNLLSRHDIFALQCMLFTLKQNCRAVGKVLAAAAALLDMHGRRDQSNAFASSNRINFVIVSNSSRLECALKIKTALRPKQNSRIKLIKGGGCRQVVSVLAFYSNDPSSNPAWVYKFNCVKTRFKRTKKRPGKAHFYKLKTCD